MQFFYLYRFNTADVSNLHINHKSYNFVDCDWFKNKLLFSTNSLAKVLSDSLLSDNFLLDSLLLDSL